MPTIKFNKELVTQLSWVLSTAASQSKLDVNGDYTWHYPNKEFTSIKSRAASVFKSGNSIKDTEVMDYVQTLNMGAFLKDPWTSNKFEEYFRYWITSGKYYQLRNLDLSTHAEYSAGSQESFTHFYFKNREKRFRVFRGEYWWHMECWEAMGIKWAYIDDEEVVNGDICIVSYPFAPIGDKHKNMDELLDTCSRIGVEVLIDFIYLPNSRDCVDIDLSADCIQQITFSLSKTFPMAQTAKAAIRLCKSTPYDIMHLSSSENVENRLGAGVALSLCQKFPVGFMVNKYSTEQQYWCSVLGLTKTKVVHLAIGEQFNSITEDISQFNMQQDRFNLGILFENTKLIHSLNLI